ncbi:MAG: FkbM family methyltransferase [Verrucomicrobia bacterium]|nr:FkbM family methyltransferase [Verrucomicrobiota bacterium]
MGNTLNRSLRHIFASAPKIYLAALKALGRGSPEKRMYLSLIRRGDVVMDIGANVGYFTELFSDLVGPSGQVHAFEPLPSTFEQLSRNLAGFPRYENVFLNCVALGDANNRVTLFIPNGDHAQAALVRHRTGSWASNRMREVKVDMIPLDRYSTRIERIDFVKCDAEGSELLVLRGGESTFRRCRPKLFLEVEEFWTSSFGWTPQNVVNFLRELGYQSFYRLGPRGLEYEPELSSGGGWLCTWEKLSGLA